MKQPPPVPSPAAPRRSSRRPALAPGAFTGGACGLLALLAPGTVPGRAQTPTTITPIPLTLSAPGAKTTNLYSQDFNGLANTNTSASLPAGFGFVETGGGANGSYAAGTGSATAGNTYSFGTAGATDRALGTLRDGDVGSTIGAVFVNNTGSNLQSLTVSYTGEQWRTGGVGQDRLDFQFNPNSGALTGTTGFADYNNLDFGSPVTTLRAGTVDGNATGNRTVITQTITGFNLIPNGQSFALRFVDFNGTLTEDGLAIDDFSISGLVAVPEPATVAAGLLALGALGWSQRRRLRGFLAARRRADLPVTA